MKTIEFWIELINKYYKPMTSEESWQDKFFNDDLCSYQIIDENFWNKVIDFIIYLNKLSTPWRMHPGSKENVIIKYIFDKYILSFELKENNINYRINKSNEFCGKLVAWSDAYELMENIKNEKF